MKLSPRLEALVQFLDTQSPETREAFQFLTALAMQEAGKFELLGISEVEGWIHYTFRSTAGDVFSVVRPEMSKEGKKRCERSSGVSCVRKV